MKKISLLPLFLQDEVCFVRGALQKDFEAAVVWNLSPLACRRRAWDWAKRARRPLWILEEGFIQSLKRGLGCSPCFGLLLDRNGLAGEDGSELNLLMEAAGWETPELLARARLCLDFIVAQDLSRYNQDPPVSCEALGDNGRPKVLLVDQPRRPERPGDQALFDRLFQAALTEHPEADIFLRPPENGDRGHLSPAGRVKLLGRPSSHLSLLRLFDEIYVVDSLLGLEALFLGKKTHCFGRPWYAGRGLTLDRNFGPAGWRRRSLEEIFAAAYLLCSRYVDPIRKQPADLEKAVNLLALQRRRNEGNRGAVALYGFSRWKRAHARAFLQSTGARLKFFDRLPRAAAWSVREKGRLVTWGGKISETEIGRAAAPLIRLEDGFLRSVGLGSDFNRPYSLVRDPDGIYYDPQCPSRLEKILAGYDFQSDHDLLERAEALRLEIVRLNISKYNLSGRNFTPPETRGRKVVLVPGQVENDASIKRGGGAVRKNLDLLRAVRQNDPGAFIIFKPHPDVERLNRPGRVPEDEARLWADHIAAQVRIGDLWPLVDEVCTMTSLVGFEALLRGLPVQVFGGPFYAGWGLTRDHLPLPRRRRRLELAELVAGALILYPDYYDWRTGLFCGPEEILFRLSTGQDRQRRSGLYTKLLWRVRELIKRFRPFQWSNPGR